MARIDLKGEKGVAKNPFALDEEPIIPGPPAIETPAYEIPVDDLLTEATPDSRREEDSVGTIDMSRGGTMVGLPPVSIASSAGSSVGGLGDAEPSSGADDEDYEDDEDEGAGEGDARIGLPPVAPASPTEPVSTGDEEIDDFTARTRADMARREREAEETRRDYEDRIPRAFQPARPPRSGKRTAGMLAVGVAALVAAALGAREYKRNDIASGRSPIAVQSIPDGAPVITCRIDVKDKALIAVNCDNNVIDTITLGAAQWDYASGNMRLKVNGENDSGGVECMGAGVYKIPNLEVDRSGLIEEATFICP